MSEHLSFDEIVNFIYSTDTEKPVTVHRVNSHIINCETCKHMYDTIYELYELGFEKGLIEVDNNLIKMGTHEVLSKATFIKLKIEQGKKLLLDNIKNIGRIKYYFSHPVALASRDLGKSETKEDTLVDDENEYNRIAINNGKLVIQLDCEDYLGRIPVLAVIDSSGNFLFLDEMKKTGDFFTVEVDIPEDGDIEVKFG